MVANSPYSDALQDWSLAQQRGDRIGEKNAVDRLDVICNPGETSGAWQSGFRWGFALASAASLLSNLLFRLLP